MPFAVTGVLHLGWGRGLLVAAITAVPASSVSPDHSLQVALISAFGAVLAAIGGPYIANWAMGRRKKSYAHPEETRAMNDHLLEELARKDAELTHQKQVISVLQQAVADQALQVTELKRRKRV